MFFGNGLNLAFGCCVFFKKIRIKEITMKKTLLSLIALISVAFGASAMSLKDAYKALSNIPNVSVTKPDYNLPMDLPFDQNSGMVLEEDNLAAAYNLNAAQIKETGDAAYTILNQVPMVRMINGGNNNLVGAFVYAEQTGENANDVLVAAMSGYRGMVVFIYEQNVPDAVVAALQSAPVEMQGSYFSLKAKLPNSDEFNIILSKAR